MAQQEEPSRTAMEAYSMALKSLTIIESHVKSCDARYGIIVKLLGWGGGTAFFILLTIAGYLLDRFGLPAH